MATPQRLYANWFAIRAVVEDFILLGSQRPDTSNKDVNPDDADFQLYISPVVAKRLAMRLTLAVQTYEKLYGVIALEPNPEAARALREAPPEGTEVTVEELTKK